MMSLTVLLLFVADHADGRADRVGDGRVGRRR